MTARSRVLAAVLLAATLLAAAATPPRRGPGAVIDAVHAILKGLEQGDRAALTAAFSPLFAEQGLDYEVGADGKLEPGTRKRGGISFLELGIDGKPVAADDAAAAAAAFAARDGVRIEHRIVRVRADCPSGECSWATVEFDRSIHRGDKVEVVPMAATLVCRYHDEAPHMRAFVWQAAPRPAR